MSRLSAWLLPIATLLAAALAAAAFAQPARPKTVALNLVLQNDTIVAAELDGKPALQSEKNAARGTIKFIQVRRNDRVKIVCQSKDKTYKLRIKGKRGTDVIVEPSKPSSPLYVVFTRASDEEIELFVGETKVSKNLFLRVR